MSTKRYDWSGPMFSYWEKPVMKAPTDQDRWDAFFREAMALHKPPSVCRAYADEATGRKREVGAESAARQELPASLGISLVTDDGDRLSIYPNMAESICACATVMDSGWKRDAWFPFSRTDEDGLCDFLNARHAARLNSETEGSGGE